VAYEIGKIDANVRYSDDHAPLYVAVRGGHDNVVKLLLGTAEVDVDAKDRDNDTPLLMTAYKGNWTVDKLLLKTGNVDVNAKAYGLMALQWAERNGNETVATLLKTRNLGAKLSPIYFGLSATGLPSLLNIGRLEIVLVPLGLGLKNSS
jgi:ankyrin repeat protein